MTTAPSHVAQTIKSGPATGTRLALNTASSFLGQAVVLLIAFFSTPYVTRKLGAAQYGTLSLLVICTYSMSLLNLGMNTSLIKYLAELMPKGEMEEVQHYFSTGLTALVGLGMFVGIVVFTAAGPIVDHFFRDTGQFAGAIHIAVRISSVAFVLQFLMQVLVAVAAGAQRFDLLSVLSTVSETARTAGMIMVVYFGGGLVAVITSLMLVNFIMCLSYGVVAKKVAPQLIFKPAFSRRHFRSLVSHSKFVLVGNTSRQLVGSADNAIIGYFLPVANLAYYGIAYSIAQRLWTLVGNVASVVFPAASAFSASDQTANVRELYLRSTKIAAAAACFPALALAVFSRQFMLYWLSPEYADKGALVLACLSVGFLLNSLTFVPFQTLQSTHYAKATAKASLIYAFINVAMFLLLIPHYGIIGAGAAFVVSQLFFVPWFLRLANRRIGVSHLAVLRAYVRVFVVGGSICAAVGMFRFAVHSLFTLGLVVGAGCALYLLAGYTLILDGKERQVCRLLLRSSRTIPASTAG